MALREQKLSENLRHDIKKRMVQIVLLMVFEAAVLFLSAGRLDWWWAWAFLGLYVVGIAVNAFFMFRYSPETIARRASAEGIKDWDKIVSGLWAIMGIVLLVVAGLDERYNWSETLPLAAHLLATAVFVAGFGLFSWAMISNAYFATVVRVQQERGHTVCTTGPYRFVRHPGYIGAILESLAMPLLLGSLWALIPGVIAGLAMVVRTAWEDQTLREELAGYAEYAQRVRYRLLPHVW